MADPILQKLDFKKNTETLDKIYLLTKYSK